MRDSFSCKVYVTVLISFLPYTAICSSHDSANSKSIVEPNDFIPNLSTNNGSTYHCAHSESIVESNYSIPNIPVNSIANRSTYHFVANLSTNHG